ncbi:MAG: biosynthetic arginine decarboxylase [Pseudomonadota bacterium]
MPRPDEWSTAEAASHYHMAEWGGGFFEVNADGHVAVSTADKPPIDVMRVIGQTRDRGLSGPVLLRFQDVLRARVQQLNDAFAAARRAVGYAAAYRAVYPIKVNQLHEVVDEILTAGRPYGVGLECGSKPELVAAVALLNSADDLLICNGYKDDDMLGLVLDAQSLGQNVIPVIEKLDEIERLLHLARERGQTPRFGIRVRLQVDSAGHWADSAGDRSKFGVSVGHLYELMQRLRRGDVDATLVLLHCHPGSQIPDIMTLGESVRELTQIYVHLARAGLAPEYLDVGGGLGVNYDANVGAGNQTAINYTLGEYAHTVVGAVAETCSDAGVALPTLLTESGRAMTAHHSLLVVPVLGAYGPLRESIAPSENVDHPSVVGLGETADWLTAHPDANVRELLARYHDAAAKRRDSQTAFRLGVLDLAARAAIDSAYFRICSTITSRLVAHDPRVLPEELIELRDRLADHYLCDFSVFQSMLDHWAIGQRFPITPLHRLDERPDRRAVLVDLTCDSDGQIRRYVSRDPEARSMDVHALRDDEPYFLGMFLMGAYQDIMGDAHNLFGRVHEVHVYADESEEDGFFIETILEGATVRDMLEQVQYFARDLERRVSDTVRRVVDRGDLRARDGVRLLERYRALFSSSPYLSDGASIKASSASTVRQAAAQ